MKNIWITEAWNPQRKRWEPISGTNGYASEESEALAAAQIRNWERYGIKVETRTRLATIDEFSKVSE